MNSAFDKLARPVQKWIRQQGWRELRDIQARSIRTIYETNADLIVAASTAGGKTEAAFFPLISQVLDEPFDGTGFDLLYIGPLKALITDQAMRLEGICQEAELPGCSLARGCFAIDQDARVEISKRDPADNPRVS